MITIPLSKNGKNAGKYEAIVDDCDADLAKLNWHCSNTKRADYYTVYARRFVNKTHWQLHRIILERKLGRKLKRGEYTNHINNNGLDNRRDNLRIATSSEINMNKRINIASKSGLKGVEKRRSGKYQARIRVHNKSKYLGTFNTPEEAHAAYCEAAKEHFGEFANNG